jgi:hypothetical protein
MGAVAGSELNAEFTAFLSDLATASLLESKTKASLPLASVPSATAKAAIQEEREDGGRSLR